MEIQNYSLRYRAGLDVSLKGVTCVIKPGEKVNVYFELFKTKCKTINSKRKMETSPLNLYILVSSESVDSQTLSRTYMIKFRTSICMGSDLERVAESYTPVPNRHWQQSSPYCFI